MKTPLDYGDLEKVAKKVLELVYANTDAFEWTSGWNQSRVMTEAVNSVAFPD